MSNMFSYENLIFIVKGAGISLLIATFSLIFGVLIGYFVSQMRLSDKKISRVLANIFTEVIRGTPMLLQLMFFYLVVPYLYLQVFGKGLDVSPIVLSIIEISINSGAYISELFRSTIISIDKGQMEAGKALGLSKKVIFKQIIMPQAMIRMIIPLANEYVTLIKDSSLGSAIGVVELLQASKIIGSIHYNYVYPLLGAGVMYLLMTLVVSFITRQLEGKYLFNA
ncbi:MAG: amino acid ABC transporter permease [Erysipelothrix sp.]|nr:amino acid ABC transporter permease [Erysipelothrix sp.]